MTLSDDIAFLYSEFFRLQKDFESLHKSIKETSDNVKKVSLDRMSIKKEMRRLPKEKRAKRNRRSRKVKIIGKSPNPKKKIYPPWYRADIERDNMVNEIRLDKGLTLKQLADKAGIHVNVLCQRLYGNTSPVILVGRSKGHVKPWVDKLCSALDVTPADLYPRYFCDIRKRELFDEDIVSEWQWRPENPEEALAKKEILEILIKQFNRVLSPEGRRTIICRFFLDETLEEIAKKEGITKEGVRIRVAYALSRLERLFLSTKFLGGKIPKRIHLFKEAVKNTNT